MLFSFVFFSDCLVCSQQMKVNRYIIKLGTQWKEEKGMIIAMDILCMNEKIDYRRVPAKIIYFLNEDDSVPAHWHTNVEIECVVSGKMRFIRDGKIRWLNAGECTIINSGSVHILRSVSEERADGIGLIFSSEYLKEVCPDSENVTFDLDICPERQELFYKTIEELYYLYKERFNTGKSKEVDDGKSYDFLLVSSYIQKILHMMMVNFRKKEFTADPPSVIRQNLRIQMSVAYIDAHYSEDLSMEDMAALTGITREYFSRSFKRYTSITFFEYLNTVRLIAAFRTLISSDLPVLDIAMDSGFPDMRAFVRCFRKKYGCSPTEYRKQLSEPEMSQIVPQPVNKCEEIKLG